MPDSTLRNLGLVVRRALRQPFSLAVLVLGAIVALTMTSGLPLAAAVALVAGYVVLKLRDEQFIRTAVREDHATHVRDDRMNRTFRIEELDVESRVKMKSIVKLQGEIAEDVANSPVDEVAAGLTDTVDQTDAIVERGLEMSRKRRDLIRYLSRTDTSAIEGRIHGIQAKLESETDPIRRSELEASLAAKKQELDDYHAIQQASARVLDQLDSIECSFSSLRARLVRIKSTDIAEWTAANAELKTELGGLNTAVDTLEESIEEALSVKSGE